MHRHGRQQAQQQTPGTSDRTRAAGTQPRQGMQCSAAHCGALLNTAVLTLDPIHVQPSETGSMGEMALRRPGTDTGLMRLHDSAGIETVDGRKVEYAQSGQGTPVVVFENGLGATLDWWAKVWPDAVAEARSLAYNRAGYGHSDTSLAPRDGAQVVDELRALLQARNLPPPYVLVGHSLGGLYMQLFARKFPEIGRASCRERV